MISGACLLAGCLDCWCSNEDTSCVKSGVVQKTELQSSFTTCSLNLPFRCAARFADRFCTQSVHQLTTQSTQPRTRIEEHEHSPHHEEPRGPRPSAARLDLAERGPRRAGCRGAPGGVLALPLPSGGAVPGHQTAHQGPAPGHHSTGTADSGRMWYTLVLLSVWRRSSDGKEIRSRRTRYQQTARRITFTTRHTLTRDATAKSTLRANPAYLTSCS